MAFIVEAEAIDDGAVARRAEDARARIAGLGQRRERTRLNKAEARGQELACDPRVLVEAGSHADGIGEP